MRKQIDGGMIDGVVSLIGFKAESCPLHGSPSALSILLFTSLMHARWWVNRWL